MKNDELIAAGHELAKCLDSEPLLDIAKLLSKMATQLDVTTEALREKTKQCEQVAQAVGWVDGGNFTIAEAVAGYVSGLKAATQRSEELAAENAALKDLAKGWANATDDRLFEEHGEIFHDSIDDCEAQLKTICPATDEFLREVRAQGVEAFAAHCQKRRSEMMKTEPNEPAINQSIAATRRAGELAAWFAAQMRQGGAA
ncbi:hypothetical protein SNQ56_002094 [Cronobacter muytjensii]|nr:hypothetical protein [Cronobacter muytjensii]